MAANTLDIGSKNEYPSNALSNFTGRHFEIDNVQCESIEGFLQALKFEKPGTQLEVCKLVGIAAKKKGKERNSQWKIKRGLWWQGEFYQRNSDEYQRLLDRLYLAVATQDESFTKAILDTGDLILTHLIGRVDEFDTVLTQKEFCSRLMKIRNLLRKGIDLQTVKKLT